MLGAYPLATTPLATLPTTGAVEASSLWINTRLDLTGAADSGIVQSMFGAGAVSLFGHAPTAHLIDSTQYAAISQPTAAALVSPVHQSYSDATVVIDPSGDALATPVVGNFSTSIYEYEPYYEDHYIQTNGSPDYMWAPSGADGVENANGIYTLFIKVLQMDPRNTDYYRFITLYDNGSPNETQVTDYIVQHYTYTDRLIFGGLRSAVGAGQNYQFQLATSSASDQGIQVFSTRVNLNTNRVRSRISAGGATLYESTDFAFVEDRDPLHVCINTFNRVISGVHTPQGQYGKFKFIAAGLVSGEATSAKLASYSTVGDARRIWGTDLFAYWTATSMYDSASPKLRNLVDATKPMYLNSLGFADRALVPYGNIAAASGSMLNTTHESTQTPVDADVLVEITVTQVDLFIEAHMPLSTEGDTLLGVNNELDSDLASSIDQSAVTGQDNASFYRSLFPIDEDATADITNSGWMATQTPVDVDAPAALEYSSVADTRVVIDGDALSAVDYSLTADVTEQTTAEASNGILVGTDESYTLDTFDADVVVIVNVTATDLDIEAHIPPIESDIVGAIDNSTSATAEAHLDADTLAGVDHSAIVGSEFDTVNADALAGVDYALISASEVAVDADLEAAVDNALAATVEAPVESSSYGAVSNATLPDVTLPATSDTTANINSAMSPASRVVLDADVEVIVNVTTTDLDIEAEIPTVTDDVFFVEQTNAASVSPRTPVDPDVVSGSSTAASSSVRPALVPFSLQSILNQANEAAVYEYEGGLEQHYLQTYNNNFLWSPMAAAGIESATGKYTLFVKILQTHLAGTFPYLPGGFFAALYDNSADGSQTVAAIRASTTQEDAIVFYGVTNTGGSNFDYSTDTAWNTTELVAALVIDQTTTSSEYISYNKLYSSLERHIEYISQARSPLHFCLNARGRNFGAFHAGAGNFATMKIIAAGLVSDTVTEQQVIDYANSKDARPVFGDSLYSYWVASLIDHDASVDPTLQMPNLVDSSKPLLLNGNVYRANQYPLPKSNPFTAELTISQFLASRALTAVEFDNDAFLAVLNEALSTARVFVDGVSAISIVYPPVSIYATTQLTITPEAYLAFAVKCVKAYLTNDPGTQATFVDSTGTEALFVNEPGTIAVLIKCR